LLGKTYSEKRLVERAGEIADKIDLNDLASDIEEEWKSQGVRDKYDEDDKRLERIRYNLVENIWLTRQNRKCCI
jgi:hypothetical protein